MKLKQVSLVTVPTISNVNIVNFIFREPHDEYWKLSHHENLTRMRLKLEPNLYHDPHTTAANLRDNTVSNLNTR